MHTSAAWAGRSRGHRRWTATSTMTSTRRSPRSLPPDISKKNDENKKRIDYMNLMREELFRKCIRQKIGF
jgi:hypothetical protein